MENSCVHALNYALWYDMIPKRVATYTHMHTRVRVKMIMQISWYSLPQLIYIYEDDEITPPHNGLTRELISVVLNNGLTIETSSINLAYRWVQHEEPKRCVCVRVALMDSPAMMHGGGGVSLILGTMACYRNMSPAGWPRRGERSTGRWMVCRAGRPSLFDRFLPGSEMGWTYTYRSLSVTSSEPWYKRTSSCRKTSIWSHCTACMSTAEFRIPIPPRSTAWYGPIEMAWFQRLNHGYPRTQMVARNWPLWRRGSDC